MIAWTQSHFLQALGWATLNSLWQMALLWGLYSFINHTARLSATRKYQAAVSAVLIGFCWFLFSFIFYYENNSVTYGFFENTILPDNNILNICLLSASVTYLLLLAFPAVRLFRNWKFVQKIKQEGQQKAHLEHRLFVHKVSFLLGISKKVKVVLSTLITSPVTVGYLKPVVLLPVAALNNLSPAQVEAILLHELSHIRRYDYLLNFVVSIIHTLLYFNPFVKLFMNTIEAEREACCDELVLQFGYDKVDYASALLHLEKTSGRHHTLILAAAGKQNLLTRIEKIVGMEKKKTFKLVQIVPIILTMFCVLLFNSVLIFNDARTGTAMTYTNDTVFTPWQFDNNSTGVRTLSPVVNEEKQFARAPLSEIALAQDVKIDVYNYTTPPQTAEQPNAVIDHFMPVNFDDVDGNLTNEEKDKVKKTVEATKKAAGTLQWKEIEASIGEVMDRHEKAEAKQEYLRELEKVSWKNIEQNLKANFDNLDWEVIDANVARAMSQVQLDSLHTVYAQALTELEKSELSLKAAKTKTANSPMPDASVEQIQMARETLQKNLEELKVICKPKQAVKL
jgi:beta-lactamase regulating signal transducer with metallopeptidase domain